MAKHARTLIIGLELGDGRLIEGWTGAGHLPALTGLRSDGTFAWLESIAGLAARRRLRSIYAGSITRSARRLASGVSRRPAFRAISASIRACTAARASGACSGMPEIRCIVLDAPYTQLEDGFSGCQVIDWGTWAPTGTDLDPGLAAGRAEARLRRLPAGA